MTQSLSLQPDDSRNTRPRLMREERREGGLVKLPTDLIHRAVSWLSCEDFLVCQITAKLFRLKVGKGSISTSENLFHWTKLRGILEFDYLLRAMETNKCSSKENIMTIKEKCSFVGELIIKKITLDNFTSLFSEKGFPNAEKGFPNVTKMEISMHDMITSEGSSYESAFTNVSQQLPQLTDLSIETANNLGINAFLQSFPHLTALKLPNDDTEPDKLLKKYPKLQSMNLHLPQGDTKFAQFMELVTRRTLSSVTLSQPDNNHLEQLATCENLEKVRIDEATFSIGIFSSLGGCSSLSNEAFHALGRFPALQILCLSLNGGSLSDLTPLQKAKNLTHLQLILSDERNVSSLLRTLPRQIKALDVVGTEHLEDADFSSIGMCTNLFYLALLSNSWTGTRKIW